ncbi:hypothetical protein MHBO_001577 [Bonamia ostreae]|uniref:Uncharacterized protein n=1 Tax=Bonamia ostreae TaxID=126728 RepID=A0ABV2AJK3_9EUKA
MKKSKNQKSDFVENKENYIEAKNIEEDYEDLESLRPEQRAVMDILTAILTNIESKNLVGMEKRKAKEIHEKLKILCKRMAEGKLSDSAFGNLAVLTKDILNFKICLIFIIKNIIFLKLLMSGLKNPIKQFLVIQKLSLLII